VGADVMGVERQEDLGVLSLAAVRHALGKPNVTEKIQICAAVAHLVPFMAESDIRLLMWEVEGAIANDQSDHSGWMDLMTVLRRVDRP